MFVVYFKRGYTCVFSHFQEKSSGVKATSISVSQLFQHSVRKSKPKNSLSKKKGNQGVSVLLGIKSKKGNRKTVLERHKKAMTNSIQAQSICKNSIYS